MGSRTKRWALYGAGIGLVLAVALQVWISVVSSTPGSDGEGIGFTGMFVAVALGFPLNALLAFVADGLTPLIHAIPGANAMHVLLLGIVANGALVGWMLSKVVRPTASSAAGDTP